LKLCPAREAVFVERDGRWLRSESFTIDALFAGTKIQAALEDFRETSPISDPEAPIGSREVFAAGVTYFRSREARMEESEKEADVYDRACDGENVVNRDDSDLERVWSISSNALLQRFERAWPRPVRVGG